MGVQVPSEPINRKEQYLAKIAGQAVEIPAEPLTREEAYLDEIAKNGSGGGGGTTNYNLLSNKPQIAGTELQGNKSLADLGIASASALANKVDKVEGKGLSTNDFTDAYKTAIGDNTNAINGIKDGQSINSFSGVESALSDVDDAIEAIDSKIDDTTEYPYADVITIEDAVPANLADCSVKVEPVQDLHGYDKPWVGGAGTNKLPINNDVATQSDSGITWFMDNGSMSIDGTASSTVRNESGNYALAVASYVIKGTEYFKLFCGGGNFSGALGLRLYFTDNTYIEAIRTRAQDTVIIKSLSTHVGKTVKGIGYYINSGCVFDHNTYSMAIVENEDDTWTPYENICPISGHTEAVVTRDGKNLFDAENTPISQLPNASGNTQSGTVLDVKAGKTYTLGAFHAETAMLYLFSKSGDTVTSMGNLSTVKTFTVEANTIYYLRVATSMTEAAVRSLLISSKVMMVLGDTVDEYVPYAGKTYTLALGDTIYGGTVDFKTGVMTVDRAIIDLGTLNWSKSSLSGHERYYVGLSSALMAGNIISDCFDHCAYNDLYDHIKDNVIAINTNNASVEVYSTYYISGYDAAQFKTAMDGHYACYELATPFTVQLTPQQIQLLQGQNTLYASTGDISVSVNGVSGAIGQVQEQVNELAGKIGENQIYSDTPVQIGTVGDKPLYRLFVTFETPISSVDNAYTSTGINSEDIELILMGDGINADGTYYGHLAFDPTFNDHQTIGVKGVANIKYAIIEYI